MGDEATEQQRPPASAAIAPVAADAAARRHGPPVVDAEFKVLSPVRGLWRRWRDSWWALGPYLAYCTALWGLAALVGWILDRGRAG